MPLSRLYTFTTGATIYASEHNAELNQLINLLNGTVLTDVTLKNSDGGTPALTVDHTGGGSPLKAKVGGITGLEVNVNRQLVLTPLAGNPPITVPSGALKVANLDVDKLDGLDSTQFLRSDQSGTLSGAAGIYLGVKETGGNKEVRLAMESDRFRMSRVDGGVVEFLQFDVASNEVRLPFNGTPTDDSTATTKAWVLARVRFFNFGAFYEGPASAATVQPTYIVPNFGKIRPTHLRASFKSGTITGPTTIKIGRYNNAGVLYGAPSEWTITLPNPATEDLVYAQSIPDVLYFTQGDQIRWTVTAEGGHADISVWLHGQEFLS